MTLVLADRVRETSPTAGSGPFTLAGAPQGYQTLSAGIGNANSSYFVAWDGAANWLVFNGTYTGAGNSVSVDSVLAQSAGFAGFAGAKTIWCDAPAALISPLLQMSASASGVQVTSKLGIGMTPVNVLDITQNVNGDAAVKVLNTNAGANASVDFIAHNGANAAYLGILGTAATGIGILQPNVAYVRGSGELAVAGNIIHFSSGTPGNNFAEVARFDATGRLGIGVVPAYILHVSQNINNSAWGYIANPSTGNNANSGWLASNGTSIAYTFMMSTGYSSGAPFRADGGGLFCNGAGGLSLGTTAVQPIYFFVNGSEVARFDVNGNFGVGEAPPAGQTTIIVDIARNQNSATWARVNNPSGGGGAIAGILLQSNSVNNGQFFQTSNAYSGPAIYRPDSTMLIGSGINGLTLTTASNAPLVFGTNGVEQARFTGNGALVLQGTAVVAAFPSDLTCQFNGQSLTGIVTNDTNAAAGTDNAMVFVRNTIAVGSIQTTLTGTAFQPSSDKNLKTEQPTLLDTGLLIDAVSPHVFTWNLTGERDFGFFAQELYAVVKNDLLMAVGVGSPDEDYGTDEYKTWGVDQSKLVAILWAEIQSLRARMARVETGVH